MTGVEADLALGVFVEALHAGDGVVHMAGSDEVGLLDEVKQEVFLPFVTPPATSPKRSPRSTQPFMPFFRTTSFLKVVMAAPSISTPSWPPPERSLREVSASLAFAVL